MTRISLETADGSIEALQCTPEAGGPWPGVVVVHDVTGFRGDIDANARRIADAGYVVLAPNLYSRGNVVRCIVGIFRALRAHHGQSIDDVLAVKSYLEKSAQCTGAVGIVGFCMGGQFALVTGASGFRASAPFYPTPLPRNLDDVVACPVVASLGGRDPYDSGAGEKLQRVLDRKGVVNDVKVYPTAGHSFANQLGGQAFLRIAGFGYDETATEDAWRRVFAFFGEHLSAQ